MVVIRSQLETTLKAFNNYQEVHGGTGCVKSREVNGRLILEGVLKLYWGIHSSIQLKEDDDQRLPVSTSTSKHQRKLNSNGNESEVDKFILLVVENFLFTCCLQNGNIPSNDSDSGDECKNGAMNSSSKSLTNSAYEVKPHFTESNKEPKYKTIPSKLDTKQLQRDELDDLLQVERQLKDHEKPYQTLPNHIRSNSQVFKRNNPS